MNEVLANLIALTVICVVCFGWWNIHNAWNLGGEYYINGNFARRKNWLERLLDGFEVLGRM